MRSLLRSPWTLTPVCLVLSDFIWDFSQDDETLLQRLEPTPLASRAWCQRQFERLSAVPEASLSTSPINRVLLADYPSTGSTWLRKVLTATVAEAALPSPECSIYQEGALVHGFDEAFCTPGWHEAAGAALFKSHFPSQELYLETSLKDWQYRASMRFDKMVVLLRHPVSVIVSNDRRWRESPKGLRHASSTLSCWASWWQQAMDAVGPANVLLLRYEDLCLDLPGEVERLFRFLGGTYANVSQADVRTALDRQRGLRCIYSAAELQEQAKAQEASQILPFISDWFWQHNYSHASVDLKTTSVEPRLMLTQLEARTEAPARQQTPNPWAGVWSPSREAVEA